AGAAAAVGGGDHVRVAPDLRIHRVAGMEHAGHRPRLAAQADLLADLEPGELALRAGADHDLALAGAETPALDDLHVRAHRPALRADAAQLHAAVLVRRAALDRQVGRDHQLGRRDRPALRIPGDARGLLDRPDRS